jgi:DNA-binding protein H-NS
MLLKEMIRPPTPTQRGCGAGGAKRASPPAKFRSPDGSETWSGRRRAPRRLLVAETEGHKRDEYLIDKPAA